MLLIVLFLLLSFASLISAGPVPADIKQVLGPKLSAGTSILSPSDGQIFVNHSSRFSEFHTATAAVVVSIANERDVVTTVCISSHARTIDLPTLNRPKSHTCSF